MRRERVLSGAWLSERIADFSHIQPHWHPLGFVSCFVMQRADESVRVHLWPAGERRPKTPNWPVHTHLFDLESHVIRGALIDRRFELQSTGELQEYAVTYVGIHSSIAPLPGRVGIKHIVENTYATGRSYTVPRGVYHETIVDHETLTLTLAVCTRFGSQPARVLGMPGQEAHPYHREPFDRDVFWELIARSCEPGY